jgi:hypothetical protein
MEQIVYALTKEFQALIEGISLDQLVSAIDELHRNELRSYKRECVLTFRLQNSIILLI